MVIENQKASNSSEYHNVYEVL